MNGGDGSQWQADLSNVRGLLALDHSEQQQLTVPAYRWALLHDLDGIHGPPASWDNLTTVPPD